MKRLNFCSLLAKDCFFFSVGKMRCVRLAAVFLILIGMDHSCFGQVLASWDFSSNVGPIYEAPLITASNASYNGGGGVGIVGGRGRVNSFDWNLANFSNNRVYFNLDVPTGYSITINNIAFDIDFGAGGSAGCRVFLNGSSLSNNVIDIFSFTSSGYAFNQAVSPAITANNDITLNLQLYSGDDNNNYAYFDNVVISGTVQCASVSPDKAALIELYEATDGDNWTNMTTPWDTSSCNVCTWEGITCNGSNRVTQINLPIRNLSGTLPNFNLPFLQRLQLGSNLLNGIIPSFNLPNLQNLDLNNNDLTGGIPSFSLSNLRILNLENNPLGGTIPVFNLPNLQILDLSFTQISDVIPNFNFPSLTFLDLSVNQLSGSIPNFNLPNLQTLSLFNNQLSGSLPNLNLPNLQFIWLYNNSLSGCFPASYNAYCGINYDFSNNPLLPWQGDFSQFCSGGTQIGAPCNNSATAGADEIQPGCFCDLSCAIFTASTSGTTTICNGDATDITFNFTAGVAPYNIVWTGGSLNGVNNGDNISVSPTTTSTYSIISATDANGCPATTSGSVTITVVNPLNVGPVSGAANVCQGATQTYSVTAVPGATSYEWTVPAGAVITSIAPYSNSISVSWPAGASSGDVCAAAVRAPCPAGVPQCRSVEFTPTYTTTLSTPITTICRNTFADLTFNFTGGTGPFDVTWSGGAPLNNIDDGHIETVSPFNNTTYTIASATDANGCLASGPFAPVTITVIDTVTVGAIAGPTNVCEGTTQTYSVAAVAGATEYLWIVPTGAVINNTPPYSNSISVSWPNGASSGDLCCAAGNDCGYGVGRCRTINFTPIPAPPTDIIGPTETCRGNIETFDVADVPFATSYIWTVPTGATITSGQNSSSITANFGTSAQSGNITVRAVNSCGQSIATIAAITVRLRPVTPVFNPGNFNPCETATWSYSIVPQASVDIYDWQLPNGGTIVSGQGTPTVTIDWAGADASSSIVVELASSLCGGAVASGSRSVTVRLLPVAPDAISGDDVACLGGGNQTYTADPVSGATSYTWDISALAGIGQVIGSTNTNTLVVNWLSTGFASFSCKANNSCGAGPEQFKTVVINTVPVQPGAISGSVAVCAGSQAIYSIADVLNADTYTWTVPAGATIVSGQGTKTITVGFAAGASGQVCVRAVNGCGTSPSRCVAVSVGTGSGSVAGTISGPSTFCPSQNSSYSIATVGGATGYNWSVPAGATILSGQNTTSISINLGSSTGGQVCVSAIGSCGAGSPSCFSVAPLAGSMLNLGADTTLCPGGSLVLSAGTANSYAWSTSATTSSITVVSSNTYTVTVTLGVGNTCTVSDAIVVNFTASVPPPAVVGLIAPASNNNVPINTPIVWTPVSGCVGGYTISIGTTPAGNEIVGPINAGNTTTYQPGSNLPVGTIIYVTLTPYNGAGNGIPVTFSFTTVAAPSGCNAVSDSLEIVNFYQTHNGINWEHQQNWLIPGKPLAQWEGLAVNTVGCLTAINLKGKNIVGPLTDFDLPELQALRIKDARLQGNIPDFSKIPKLRHLVLSDNELSGELPDFTMLDSLWVLEADTNNLTGQLPNFSQLPTLIILNFKANQLSGVVPIFLYSKQLKYIDLGDNLIGGVIPNFNHLTKLQSLDLSKNLLKSTIPDFGNPDLEFIYLNENNLSGPIPALNTLLYKNHLSLEGNRLTFDGMAYQVQQYTDMIYARQDSVFHDTLLVRTAGQNLDFSLDFDESVANNNYTWKKDNIVQPAQARTGNNDLEISNLDPLLHTGVWTVEVRNPSASDLVLYSKKIILQVNTTTCNVVSDSLEIVNFYNTHNGPNWAVQTNWLIAGKPIEDWYGISTNNDGCISAITLSDKQITGVLPDLNLPHLINLYIVNSSLSGTVPNFTKMPLLERLNLTDNELTGEFPDFLYADSLLVIDADTNAFTGGIPYFSRLKKLFYLDLNYNQLDGPIPDINLPELLYLDLNTNQLSGTIPNLTGLPKLEFLGLAENNLKGTIPNFNQMPDLEYIYLNYNRLSGQIPDFNNIQNKNTLGIDGNRLTFDGMAYQVQQYTDIAYAPQDSVFHDTLLVRNAGQNLDFSLDFDENVANNMYTWKKDNIVQPAQARTGNNDLEISNLDPLLHAGVWTVEVRNSDAPDLVLNSKSITLQINTVACPDITNNGPFCVGENISVQASNFTEFEWVSGPNGVADPNLIFSASLADAGTYFYTGQCFPTGSFNGSVTVQVIAGPSVTATATGSFCPGSTVQLQANGSGAIGWSWSGPNGFVSNIQSPVISNLSAMTAGVYTVTVTGTGASACTATSTVTVVQLSVASPTISSSSPTCIGNDLTLTENSGTATQWAWTGPSNFSASGQSVNRTNLNASMSGIYTVTATNTAGCTATSQRTVNITSLGVTAQITNVNCLSNVSVQASGNGAGPFEFDWADLPGSNDTPDRIGLSPGTYLLTITDMGSGCTDTWSANISSQPGPSASVGTTNAACGQNNGSVTLNVINGAAPYFFIWDNSATTQNLMGIGAGDYVVTVTDNNNCTTTATATVGQTGNPPTLSTTIGNAACGQSTGSINLMVTGGTAPFNYDWADVAGTNNTQNRSNLAPNTYIVTVSDAAGCTASATATVGQTGNPPTLSTTIGNAACGQSNGSINLSVAGGTAPFNYDWADVAGTNNTQNRSNLAPNTYVVTVSDAAGCTASATANVGQTGNPPTLSTTIGNAACGQSNGSINLSVAGGTAPFNYDWADVAGTNNTQNRSNLAPNTYVVTVSDAAGCTASTTAVVGQTGNPPTLSTTIGNAACGQSNGSINLSVAGGTAPFNYDWADVAGTNNTQNRSNLAPNTYVVTVSDAAGCTASATVVVGQTGNPPTLSTTIGNAACGQSNGSINLTVAGGTAPFNYDWADVAGTNNTQNRSNLAPNTYVVTVSDAAGCTASATAVVGQTGNPPTLSTAIGNAACGQSNGSINLSVAGGTAPFNYDWADVAGTNNTQNRSNLAPNTYAVTVSDAAGCTATATATVGQTGNPPTLSTTIGNAACGQSNGSINLSVAGGTAPFNYDWADVADTNNTQNRSNLAPNTYVVTVSDAAGCTASATATVGQTGNPPTLSTTIGNAACGQSNGSINLTVAGGTAPFNYDWADVAGTNNTQNRNNLAPNTYVVTVSDAAGCTATTTATVGQTGNYPVTLDQSRIICTGESVVIGPFTYQTTGIYLDTIRTPAGCDSVWIRLQLTVQGPELTLSANKNPICAGKSVALSTQVLNCAACTYLWNTGSFTNGPLVLTPTTTTTYSLVVTDNLGCTAAQSLEIEVQPLVQEDRSAILCPGESYKLGNLVFTDAVDTLVKIQSLQNCDTLIHLTLKALKAKDFVAKRDTFRIQQGFGSADLGVLLNDQFPSVPLLLNIDTPPTLGTATTVGDSTIQYSAGAAVLGLDSLHYTYCAADCPEVCTSATAIILILADFVDLSPIIPNIITPNEDGFNDNFDPLLDYSIRGFVLNPSSIRLQIYTRSGDLLMDKIPYEPWNGRSRNDSRGKYVPAGQYFYVLHLANELGATKVVKGPLTVVYE